MIHGFIEHAQWNQTNIEPIQNIFVICCVILCAITNWRYLLIIYVQCFSCYFKFFFLLQQHQSIYREWKPKKKKKKAGNKFSGNTVFSVFSIIRNGRFKQNIVSYIYYTQ